MDQALGKLLSIFSSTGKSILEASEILQNTITEEKASFSDLSDPLLAVREFVETIGQVRIYNHEDFITGLIREKLKILAIRDNKLNVMIVDDMDRIDPEHLFRIISIFSSHIDSDDQNNKFGFDKIIFVGDNENFRAIFNHKYGRANNYDAYISKLSSKGPFTYHPDRELYHQIIHLLEGIKFSVNGNDQQPQSIYWERVVTVSRYYNYILCALIKTGALTLRELVKLQGTQVPQVYRQNAIRQFNNRNLNLGIYL